MAINVRPNIVTNGLVLNLDAANIKSYPRSGTTWRDLSGLNNNSTLTNGPTFNNQFLGNISFDGIDDYTSIANLTNTTAGFTWDFWINFAVDQPVNPNFWCYFYTSGSSTIEIGIYNSSPTAGFAMANYEFAPTRPSVGVSITRGVWTHITLGCNNFIPFMYNNASSYSTGSAFNNYTLRVGELFRSQYYTGRYMKGSLANFRSYNRALSPSEVQQNYNATKTRFGLQ